MSDATDKNPSPAPSLQKQKKTPWMIIGVVIVVVVALIAVVVLGGFLNPTETNVLNKIRKNGKIVVGTQVPYPPFENFNSTSGKYEGIDMEIIEKVAAYLNVSVEYKAMDFDPLFGAVSSGQIDVAISSITITDERNKTVAFSSPYYDANQAVLVKEDSTISNIDGLNGTKVVVQLGTTGAQWATENLVDTNRIASADLSQYTDVPAATLSVENGQNAAFIVDTPVAYGYTADPNYNVKVGYVIPTNEHYGIMLQKGQTDLAVEINLAIAKMIADGSLNAILVKWHAAA